MVKEARIFMTSEQESVKKGIAKTVTWRIIATLTTMMLVLIFTRQIELALTVGVLETVTKTIFYFAHERLWSKRMVK